VSPQRRRSVFLTEVEADEDSLAANDILAVENTEQGIKEQFEEVVDNIITLTNKADSDINDDMCIPENVKDEPRKDALQAQNKNEIDNKETSQLIVVIDLKKDDNQTEGKEGTASPELIHSDNINPVIYIEGKDDDMEKDDNETEGLEETESPVLIYSDELNLDVYIEMHQDDIAGKQETIENGNLEHDIVSIEPLVYDAPVILIE
jgi:hypothetical protein